ncbi:PSD1 and planctomycete cytochrome C domain-containing protein [Verrucomicrobia bacterium]|nr:PSD1 and planctomycete cytochrome C domain-containing protein [Verrucomicrobiota bacterium]
MLVRFSFLLAIVTVLPLVAAEFSAVDLEFFEKKIRPVLVEHCYKCHSAESKKLKAGLRLDHRAGVIKGGDSGPSVVSGKPEQSRLIEAIGYDNVDLEMPPRGKLNGEQIADLTEWVKRGAPWPKESVASGTQKEFNLAERRAEHWAWQPVKKQTPPKVKQSNWPASSIDHFILKELETKGIKPADPASNRTFIRRAYFDLTGLPPSPQAITAFEQAAISNRQLAIENLIDGLLASPHFGERWGRHWLDLMRYAETFGHEFDFQNQEVWRYRDYVIRAFNDDVPYDRFVKEHIAGDQIKPRFAKDGGWNESRLATTWWWLGQHCHSPVDIRAYQAEIIDNQIDVIGKAFQGMTIACARCHDHKFDAISTRDFYALYGMIESGSFSHGSVEGPAKFGNSQKTLLEIKGALKKIFTAQLKPVAAPKATAAPEEYHLISDIRRSQGKDWFADGAAWMEAITTAGEFTVEAGGLRGVPAGWLHSGLVGRKFQGTIRSQTFEITENHIHLLALGRDVRVNVVIDNFKIIQNPIYGGNTRTLNNEQPHWVTFNVAMWKGHHCYLEIVDLSIANHSGKRLKPDGYAAVRELWISAHGKPPAGALPRTGELIKPDGAKSPEATALLKEYLKLVNAIPPPATVPVMLEGTARNEKVFIRGGHGNLGPEVPRRFLTALVGEHPPRPTGSGRITLANQITDTANPLTARVYANRIWHHLLGRGIVPSTDNFGVLGEAPTHPELLDWLAQRLVEDGWSTKKLIREIMLSRTYRMSSKPANAATEAKDPANTLLHRMRVRRLEGEAIRDAILTVSGRLDKKMYGPPVAVHLTPFMEGRGRPRSGPEDGAGRRTIYQEVRRNFLSPMMLAFDQPFPLSTFGRRTSSNVPAQALILMNDPFVVAQSKLWSKRILSANANDPARIRTAYETAFGRPPNADEQKAATGFLQTQAKAHGEKQPAEKSWSDFCHVLFNVKEFVFLN